MMNRNRHRGQFRRFIGDTSGAFLPEFAVSIMLFLFILFGLIDFGRMGYGFVMAEKAAHIAARIAAVRPPVCTGVPETHAAGTTSPPDFGTYCRAGADVCANVAVTCSGGTDATSSEIWSSIRALMPAGSSPANLQFSYVSNDPDQMGFLGGPFVPNVTVELTGLQFRFVTPVGLLAGIVTNSTDQLSFPPISTSMPGEDLNHGSTG